MGRFWMLFGDLRVCEESYGGNKSLINEDIEM